MSNDFRIGSRCGFSDLGKQRSPRLTDREGIVIAIVKGSKKIRVLLDGNKFPSAYHRDYLRPVRSQANPAMPPAKAR